MGLRPAKDTSDWLSYSVWVPNTACLGATFGELSP
jgi:hypothetical protein